MKSILTALAALLILSADLVAQVTISPTAVFISRDRFGSFVVINNSNLAQEVSIDFMQTYPSSDSLGNVVVKNASETPEQFKLITDWIRSFPRTFVLEPGQRQTVRLTVRPAGTLGDGTYWTRLKVTSNPRTPEIGEVSQEQVATAITIRFEQLISGFYKVGTVNTGITVKDIRHHKRDDSGLLLVDYDLLGNSPFIGTIELKLTDAQGRTAYEGRVVTSLYENGTRNFAVPAGELPAGTYSATATFLAQRPDIPQADVVPMETVVRTVQVRVQ